MIIDSHQHVLVNHDYQLQYNKQCGIEKVILFPTVVHPEKASDKKSFLHEMDRLQKILNGEINPYEARITAIKELVVAIALAPDFYIGFAPCPSSMDYKATEDWIENYIVKNNLRGIGELTFGNGNVPYIENIFRCIHDHNYDLPLWIHTFDPLSLSDIREITDLAHKYPSTKVIMGHGGGRYWMETIDLVKKQKNIYIDMSASYTVFSLKFIAQELPEKGIFSSDFPYGDPFHDIFRIEHLIKDRSIRENILGTNVRQLLKL
ncbi:MAG TPA: amidohydrolase family protein [Chitinispirillaceae bacterium]|nr:amidohydrolase family protein [Chitinispirillaceae bacterium]